MFYIDTALIQGGSGTLNVKDHTSNSILTRTYTAGTQSQELATIPSQSDEYTLEVTLTGGQSSIHFMIAGGMKTIGNCGIFLPTLVMMHGMTGTSDAVVLYGEILPEMESTCSASSVRASVARIHLVEYENEDQPGRRILT